MPASPLEPALGMVVTPEMETVDKGFFSCKQTSEESVISNNTLCAYLYNFLD